MNQPSTSDTSTTPGNAQDFAVFLVGIDKGRFVRECGEAIQQVVAAIEETGKGGVFQLRFDLKPAGKSGAITVTPAVVVKAPKLARAESIFFPDQDHNLVRDNPSQTTLY